MVSFVSWKCVRRFRPAAGSGVARSRRGASAPRCLVGLIAARRRAGRRPRPATAKAGIDRQCRRQAPGVGQHAGDEGPGRQAEQVLEQRQHRRAGGAHAGVDDVDDDRRHRADGAGRQEAAEQRSARTGLRRRAASRARRRRSAQHQRSRRRTAAPARASLRRGWRAPARSTTPPQITLPAAPASTTSAAFTAACAGAMPCTRFRKLGSHDHSAETTISCAAPPMHTHSMVRERASDSSDVLRRLAERLAAWRPAPASSCTVP